ncbi:hypothetical protein RYX36_026211 [Vicia faba]
MSQTETLSLIHEIESLFSDQLQVVSYKWFSRSYLISSDESKRLLQEFVQKHEGGLEVVYALSGWLKSTHPSYHIRLVAEPKLAEAQQEFDGHCSVQNTVPISIAKVDHTSQNMVKQVKSEINGTGNTGVHDNINKPTPNIDDDSKIKMMNFFRHTAYFLVAGDELKNPNQQIPYKL